MQRHDHPRHPATSASRSAPTRPSSSPPTPSSRSSPAASAARTCGPTAARTTINPGDTIGHECVGVVEEVGSEVTGFSPGDFVVVPFCHCDNTCAALPGRRCTRPASTSASPTSGQAEYARVTQAEGSMVRTDGDARRRDAPVLLALSDVMATGWHAAVAAGVARATRVVVVGDGAVGLCGVLAAAQMGAERVIAMSRHEPRQEIARALRGDRRRRGARRGGRRRGSRRSPTASGPTPCWSASAPTTRCRRPSRRAARRDGRLRRRAARRGAAGAPDVRQEHRAGRRHRAGARATCPTCSTWSPAGRSTRVRSST